MTVESEHPPVPADPPRALPARALAVSLLALIAALVGGAYGLTAAFAWSADTRTGIVVGGLVSLACCTIAIAVLRPTRPRPTADWTVHWIGATTLRFLLTPIGLFSVYSATLLPGMAVLLGGTAAYLAALAVETVVIARALSAPARECKPKSGS